MRVLVFPGGTEIGQEIWSALRDCKDVELAAAGVESSTHAPFVFSEFHPLPGVHEQGWIAELNRLVEKLRIEYIYPAHDDVVLALANHAHEIHASLVISPPETCRITRFKSKTYEALRGTLPVPRVYLSPAGIDAFPVFCKPDRGQGSYRARRVDSMEQLAADFLEDDLILEYLPGTEYTVDCFSDRDRGLMFVGGRERVRVRNGISVAARPVEDPAFEAYAQAISGRLALHGAWFFQLKQDREGRLKLLEVGPRIAGAMALYRVSGINFPLLSLYELRRLPLRILRHNAQVTLDRALVNRYKHDLVYRTVYVDLDDTLILRGRVNTRLVALLYQCLNRGVRLVLLTRHARNPQETLARYRIAQLFDEIVHLSPDQPKSVAIRDRCAIFIDDSFSERLQVHEATGIPTFDCSMIEMLFDAREPAACVQAPVDVRTANPPALDRSEWTTVGSTGAKPQPGYLNWQYAASFKAFGFPRELPRAGGWLLERQIPDSLYLDAMGCYPLFCCQNWGALKADLDAHCEGLVSVALVADPFGDYAETDLKRSFDSVVQFKEHFVVDLDKPGPVGGPHHRKSTRQALSHMDIHIAGNPVDSLDDWVRLYDRLIARRQLKGIKAFSRAAFRQQLCLPGVVLFLASREGAVIGANIWIVQNDVAYAHLLAMDDTGYKLRAAYALTHAAIEHMKGRARWANLGGNPGAGQQSGAGLSSFKAGWATETRTALLCGKIVQPALYAELARRTGAEGAFYFPAYRAGELV
jgi:hypothetical protein